MSVQKRRCATCKFFNDAQMSGNGWCTHPKRQLSTDVRILVRKGELACRNSWGGDLWLSLDSPATISEPLGTAPEVLVSMDDEVDDRVTLVSNQTADPASRDDIVVEHASMLSEDALSSLRPRPLLRDAHDDELNIPAYEDQAERAQVIAKGSRNAILCARERLLKRRGVDFNTDRPANQNGQGTFDDETPSQVPADRHIPRNTAPVPVSEMGRSNGNFVSQTGHDRFSSIPEIRPDVELPRLREFLQSPASSTEGGRSNGQPVTSASYDLVLQRAQAIKGAARSTRSRLVVQERSRRSNEMVAFREAREAIQHYQEPVSADEDALVIPEPTIADDRMRIRTRDAFGFEPLSSTTPDINEAPSDNQPDDNDGWSAEYEDDREAESFSQPTESTSRRRWWNRTHQGMHGQTHTFMDQPGNVADDATDTDDGFTDEASTFAQYESGLTTPEDTLLEDEVLSVDDSIQDIADNGVADDCVISDNSGPNAEYETGPVPYQETLPDNEFDYEPDDDEILDTGYTEDESEPSTSYRVEGLTSSTEASNDRNFSAPQPRTEVPDAGFDLGNESGLDAFRAALFGGEPRQAPAPRQQQTTRPVTRVGFETRRNPSRQTEPRHTLPTVMRTEPSPQPTRSRPTSARRPTPLREALADAPAFDIREYVSGGGELLDMNVDLAPELSRSCRNCRDFRPSESGERGWCTNSWAFSHRQMVNADDHLPCNSTIGCWWLPVDQSWLPNLDQYPQAENTPRTDRLIARRYQYQDEEEAELYVREI